jgi:ACT domain-containing protein
MHRTSFRSKLNPDVGFKIYREIVAELKKNPTLSLCSACRKRGISEAFYYYYRRLLKAKGEEVYVAPKSNRGGLLRRVVE